MDSSSAKNSSMAAHRKAKSDLKSRDVSHSVQLMTSSGEEWEDLGASGHRSVTSIQSISTIGSIDSDVMAYSTNTSLSSATNASSMSAHEQPPPVGASTVPNINTEQAHVDELEQLLMEAQHEGGSSRGTSIRSSSGPHSPVWSTNGGEGTGFSSPIFLQLSTNQSRLEAALSNYSSRPEGTPLKPHELAEKFRHHPNGGTGVSNHFLSPEDADRQLHVHGYHHSEGSCISPADVAAGSESSCSTEKNEMTVTRWISSTVHTLFSPPYSYFMIPTHLIMFGLGAICAYVCFAKRVFRRYI